jgi:hypothetical protein
MGADRAIVRSEVISGKIRFIRGTRVMLDADLALLYGVTTSNLNKAVKRNRDRFPADFMFQLSKAELQNLRFQIGISRLGSHGGRRYQPLVFTEQGIAMLSSVLGSSRAVQVNIAIVRTFVRLREMLTTNDALRRKIEEMEKRYDAKFQIIFDAIKRMLEAPAQPKRVIGFHARVDPQKPASARTRLKRK